MKKLTALILALTLVLSCSATAFAAVGKGDQTQEVKGTYQAGTVSDTIYSVDISWEGLSFTYTAPAEGTWNPTTLSYDGAGTEGSWSGTGTITVKNRSNTAITATPKYAANANYEGAEITFDKAVLTVANADTGAAVGTEQSGTITVQPSGDLPEGTEDAVIGTITLTIA